jgi:hypothetical protein
LIKEYGKNLAGYAKRLIEVACIEFLELHFIVGDEGNTQ